MAVRIPKTFAVQTQIERDSVVDLSLVNGEIVVKPQPERPKYTLKELLKGISDENVHYETDWGSPVGKEML